MAFTKNYFNEILDFGSIIGSNIDLP